MLGLSYGRLYTVHFDNSSSEIYWPVQIRVGIKIRLSAGIGVRDLGGRGRHRGSGLG